MKTCEWFAKCDRPAAGTVRHPVLGSVPTCVRCATRMELSFEGATIQRDPETDRWVLRQDGHPVSSAVHLYTMTRRYPEATVIR